MRTVTTRIADLDCRVVDTEDGNAPELAVILCHGYGAPGDDLVPIAQETMRAHPELAGRVRFVFPEAPQRLDHIGIPGGRAWWEIDVERLQRAILQREFDWLRQRRPEGLDRAWPLVDGVFEELTRSTGLRPDQVILGGFSQGAMLTTDLTLRREDPPAALVALSGTLLDEPNWRRRAPARRGLPVLQTHGRQDPMLPFQAAEWLRDLLVEAGLDVDFRPFDGPHTVSPEGIRGLADLAADRLAAADR